MEIETFDVSTKSDCIEDNRIMCSNSKSLDNILALATSKVECMADSLDLGDGKSQFVSRVLEVLKVNVKENVTVNGLPYSPKDGSISVALKDQKLESKEELFSKLGKKVCEVAGKRKKYPRSYCRILEKKLAYRRDNTKHAKITNPVCSSSTEEELVQLDVLSPTKLKQVDKTFEISKNKMTDALKELKTMQQNIKYAENIASQKPYADGLYDTGYNSS